VKITFFSTQPYDKTFFENHNKGFGFELEFFEVSLNEQTLRLVHNTEAICVFVNDQVNRSVIEQLAYLGIKIIALRCAGFNNVDLKATAEFNIKVVRVPAYSPHAVAEHAVAMIMTLNRKTHKAYNRIREQNFSLNGLMGFDLAGKTVGIIGTGNIGKVFCQIMLGFGCHVLAFDIQQDEELTMRGVPYLSLDDLLLRSDIISLHCPLTTETHYLINNDTITKMKEGVMLINTSRGALIDTKAVIRAMKDKKISALGIDVYEQEENLFFHDLSDEILEDDTISRLMNFPNVLITSHQGFFTQEALTQITETTFTNLMSFKNNEVLRNEIKA